MSETITTTLKAEDRFTSVLNEIAATARETFSAVTGGNAQARESFRSLAQTAAEAADAARAGWAQTVTGISSGLDVAKQALQGFAEAWKQGTRLEDASTRLAPLLDSMDRSRELCEALRDEAANGTMDFEQLVSVAQRLATVFKSTENIKKWTTAFHDLSAGTGLDVNELVGNFVRSKASGRFEAGFMDMFAQKGVNIYAPLAKELDMSEAALRQLASTGKLAFSEVENAILSLTQAGGQFSGMAAKMSGTASGSLSTLAAQAEILVAKFVEPFAEGVTPALNELSATAEKLRPAVSALGNAVGFIASSAANLLAGFPGKILAAGVTVKLFSAGVAVLVAKLKQLYAAIITQTRPLVALNRHIKGAHGSFTAFARGLAAGNAQAQRTATLFRSAIPNALRVSKAALVSTGLGIALVAIGEAAAWAYGKFSEGGDAAEDFADRLRGIEDAYAGLTTESDVAEQAQKDADALAELAGELEELKANGSAEAAAEKTAQFEQLATAQAQAQADARRKIREKEAAERAEAAKKELAEASKRAEDMRALAEQAEAEAVRSRQKAPSTRRAQLLADARVGSGEELDAEISALSELGVATKEEREELERLLGVRKQLRALDDQMRAAQSKLRERVTLARAELESAEALAAAKEKIYLAEVKAQFVAAGQSEGEAENSARRLRELEKQVEDKRAADKSASAVSAEERKLALLKAELSGNEQLAAQLREQARLQELIAANKGAGMSGEEAERLARERLALESEQEKRKDASERGADAGTRVGAGTVGTAQANVGGGRSVNIGMSGAVSVAQQQLRAEQAMAQSLKAIERNTASPQAAVLS